MWSTERRPALGSPPPRARSARGRRTTGDVRFVRAKKRTASSTKAEYRNWSNPTGETVREIVKGKTYVCERSFVWNSIDVGGRCAVVKLKSGELWIHSPIDLDEKTKSEIDKIGTVKHVVSPNYEHLKYAKQWKRAYPNAILWACPGLKEKKKRGNSVR